MAPRAQRLRRAGAIPLLVKLPGQREAGRRIAQQVQAVDVLPTVLASQKLAIPLGPRGRPLQPVIAGRAEKRPAVSEVSHRGIVAHGVRTELDKYVRRFSPEKDELYFDLVKDPKARGSLLQARPERVRFLKAQAESAMSPNPFRYVLRIAGRGATRSRWRAKDGSRPWSPRPSGPRDRFAVEENGRRLEVLATPQPGRPREIAFTLRPRGAPVLLQGTRDGRPLRRRDVATAESARSAPRPARAPARHRVRGGARARGLNLFSPPQGDHGGRAGLDHFAPGRKLMDLDKETREWLKAMGYLGAN